MECNQHLTDNSVNNRSRPTATLTSFRSGAQKQAGKLPLWNYGNCQDKKRRPSLRDYLFITASVWKRRLSRPDLVISLSRDGTVASWRTGNCCTVAAAVNWWKTSRFGCVYLMNNKHANVGVYLTYLTRQIDPMNNSRQIRRNSRQRGKWMLMGPWWRGGSRFKSTCFSDGKYI